MRIDKVIKIGLGQKVNRMAIGTWGFGGYMEKNCYDAENIVRQIQYLLKKGLNIIDCWARQAQGYTLTLIREAIRQTERSNVFLVAKLDVKLFSSADDVVKACENYLEALNVNYLDMIQICKPEYREVPAKDVVVTMNDMLDEGIARFLGISNANVFHINEFYRYTRNPLVSNEIRYSLFDRKHEVNGTVDFCEKENIRIMAYGALNEGNIREFSDSILLTELCNKYKKTMAQLAFNWLLSKKSVIPYMMSTDRKHSDENFGAFHFVMTDEEYEELDRWR